MYHHQFNLHMCYNEWHSHFQSIHCCGTDDKSVYIHCMGIVLNFKTDNCVNNFFVYKLEPKGLLVIVLFSLLRYLLWFEYFAGGSFFVFCCLQFSVQLQRYDTSCMLGFCVSINNVYQTQIAIFKLCSWLFCIYIYIYICIQAQTGDNGS